MTLAGKRIGLLTDSASRRGGGVFEAVVCQAALVRDLGAEPLVFALADTFSDADRARFEAAEVALASVWGPRQLGYAPTLARRLVAADLDLLHLHGLWVWTSGAGARWATATRRPYLISPHGMLDPWITARGRWKKALARRGFERRSWARAAAFHALTDDEAADIAAATGRAETLVIPNPAPPVHDIRPQRSGVLYLGRLHEKKNLDGLVEGWTRAAVGDATLTIAGWGSDAEVAAVEAAAARAGGSVRFVGAVHGAEKQALLDTARWLVLPSLSEGLPMVVLEAWSAGTPTIMTAACHLPEGFAGGAALPCGASATDIAAALTAAVRTDDQLWQTRSDAAKALASGPFSTDTIRERWRAAYAGLLA